MALSANRDLDHYVDQELRSFKVAASEHIYKGAFVGLSAGGHVRSLSAGDVFVGIAYEEADNASGSAGDISVRVYTLGDFGHALSGAAISNVGDAVYASADDTLTITSASNSYVGYAVDVPSSGQVILRLETFKTVP